MKRFIAIFMTLCLVLGISSISVWATEEDTWQEETPMPTARYELTSSVVGDKIYAIGGNNNGSGSTNTVEIYDTRTDIWTTGKSMPTARFSLTSSVVGDKIYAIGGNNGSGANTVEIYDTQTDTWTTGKSMPTARYGLTSAVVGDKIYAIGGQSPGRTNTVEVYDIKTDTWTTGKSILTARMYLKSAVVGSKIYAIGGYDSNGKACETIESLQVGGSSDILSTKLSVLLNTGESVQLSTSYDLDNNKNFIWSSTNEAVAIVDANGKVTAVAEGTADIYAQNADGTFKEYIPVKVVKGIADELRLAVHLKTGEIANLYLTDDASKVTWSSMDNSIATVSADGKVTAVKKGLAIIKGELEGKSYQIYVRVNG